MRRLTKEELAGMIDLTLLKPQAAKDDYRKLFEKARAWPFATVCVPPWHVPGAVRALEGSKTGVSTVAGFPLGYQAPGIKQLEAGKAFGEGAAEIDVVMNVSAFKSGEINYAADEISEVVSAAPGAVVKVIIEAAYLTDGEKREAVEVVASSGAAFVKTSTGFAPGGATASDVRLLKEASGGRVKVKAAGGVGGTEAALELIEAGADRIGASRGLEIISGL